MCFGVFRFFYEPGFLRLTLFSCPQNVKEAAYKGMVRSILEYGSSVWDPHPDKLQEELERKCLEIRACTLDTEPRDT